MSDEVQLPKFVIHSQGAGVRYVIMRLVAERYYVEYLTCSSLMDAEHTVKSLNAYS